MPRASNRNKRLEQRILLDAAMTACGALRIWSSSPGLTIRGLGKKIIYMQWKQILAKASLGITIAIPEVNSSKEEKA